MEGSVTALQRLKMGGEMAQERRLPRNDFA